VYTGHGHDFVRQRLAPITGFVECSLDFLASWPVTLPLWMDRMLPRRVFQWFLGMKISHFLDEKISTEVPTCSGYRLQSKVHPI
jgi:hypothetical protein